MLPLIACAFLCSICRKCLQNTVVGTCLSIWVNQVFVTACLDHTCDAMPN